MRVTRVVSVVSVVRPTYMVMTWQYDCGERELGDQTITKFAHALRSYAPQYVLKTMRRG